MADIIIFPGEDSRYRTNIDKILDTSLNIDNHDVKNCIRDQVSKTLSKYRQIPILRIKVPISISESDAKVLTEALTAEYNEKISDFARTLILDICVLHAKLCRYEHDG